ncbi:MAG: sugar O-acetyltransferase [Bacilli bacterium]|nr:sugar O-acetyltransferase [Bacilli bacterium]
MKSRQENRFFAVVDKEGVARNDEPYFEDGLQEIIRCHELSLRISSKKPTDEDYHALLCELFQTDVDPSVSIVSPFYCDNGCRVQLGKNITINKGATLLSAGIIEIQDGVLIGPDVKIATMNHDLKERHHKFYFKKVTIKKNAWICIGAILCPGVTIGENSVVAAGAVVTKDVPDNTIVGGNPAKIIKHLD